MPEPIAISILVTFMHGMGWTRQSPPKSAALLASFSLMTMTLFQIVFFTSSHPYVASFRGIGSMGGDVVIHLYS